MDFSKAENTARRAHEGQEYNNGLEYIFHPTMAAEFAQELGYPQEVVEACFLHDVLEDTDVPEADLRSDFGDVVVDAVLAVTYTEADEDNGIDKVTKAKSNPLGHVVKFCDASSNFAATVLLGPKEGKSAIESVDKYGGYVQQLRLGLPSPEEIAEYIEEQTQQEVN